MIIAPIHADQLEIWAEMRASMWPESSRAEHLADLMRSVAGPARRLAAFVASVGAEPLGFVEISLRTDPVNGCDTLPVAFVEGLYVRPAHRRRGVARRLLGAAEAWGRAQGCSELGSDTDWENREGRAFHAALGFEETERVVFFRKSL